MSYFDEISKSMNLLSAYDDTLFLGQAVAVPGTAMFNTLKDVPLHKRLELPVFEDTQLGMSIGLCIAGYKPISIFPRWNFLLCAANQLLNHLDKYKEITEGRFCPSVIIRTSVGSQRPLFPGHQHVGNYSSGFRQMLSNTDIIELKEARDIVPAYEYAYHRNDGKSTILVEYGDFYNEK